MKTRPKDPGAALMLAFQRGDEAAFERLVDLYAGRLYGLLTRFLGPVPEREDLVQEVFLRVVRARERYRPTARLSTWLYRIAFNLCANERQRRAAGGAIERAAGGGGEDREAQDSGSRPAAGLEREDVVRSVHAAIARLPDTQRLAILLAKFEEMPYAEIARVLDSTPMAVKSLVHRAREALRAELAPLKEWEAVG